MLIKNSLLFTFVIITLMLVISSSSSILHQKNNIGVVDAFVSKIAAGTEECYHELVDHGTTVSITFTVTAGGKLDLDATVNSLSLETGEKKRLHSWKRASEGTHEFTAPAAAMPYRYEVCFSNAMARWTPKWVSFDFFKMLPAHDDGITGDANKPFQKIEVDLHTCANRVFNIRNSMNKLKTAEINHRDTMESVVGWIVWGSILQCVLLVGLAIFEFFYLKSFLAVRNVVRI
jgi:hypothetical protein